MTATRNGRTGRPDPSMYDAYPKPPPYDAVDVDEAKPPPPDPNAQDTGKAPPTKHPLLPAWMKTGEGLRRNVTHVTPIAANNAIYWALWPNWYAVRPIGWAARGALLAGTELVKFAVDAETRTMRKDAAQRRDGRARAYERKELHRTRRQRAIGTAAWLAGVALVATVLTSAGVLWWSRLALAALVVGVLAYVGRPQDRESGTSVRRPHESEDPAKNLVHSDRVVAVFADASIRGAMTVGGTHRRTRGPDGWEALVDLPKGTTVAEALKVHNNLCSSWQIPKERLHLQRAGHEGQVHMTVFDQDPMTTAPVRTPLRDLQPRCLWDPVPVGTTAYGDPYSLVLPGTSGVWVCSAPGYGKTNFLQLLLAVAALGVRPRVFIHDGKGEGDLEVYRGIADHFSQGSNDAAGRDCARMLAQVRDLRGERATLIRRVRAERPDLMPSSQITREVTEDPQWGLALIVVLIDEFNLMVKTDSGDDIQKETVGIAEGCRSGGIIPVIAGQNFRAGVLDGAQASIGSRVAFKTNTPEDSNMILGKGQVSEGFNTSRWPDDYQGVAVVRPAGRQVQSGTHQVKMHLGEYEDHVAIAAHARRLRAAAGGVLLAKGDDDLLERVLAAMGAENVVPVDDLADRLGVELEEFVTQMRRAHVPVEKSRSHGNRRAVRRRDVTARLR